MRRHLRWIAAAALVAALAILLVVASRPPVARAPTAAPSGTPSGAASPPMTSGSPAPSPEPSRSASATPRITRPPGSASLPPDAGPTPEGYRAPPDSFDAASVRWAGDAVTGSSQEKRFGLWTAGLDGRDLREVARGDVGTGAALVAPDALAPEVLLDVATVLVYAVLPVGFFVLGVNLAAEAEEGALPFPPPFDAAIGTALGLRLLAAPALMLAFSAAIVTLPDAYLLQAAMPSGINSLVVAHAYGLDLRITSAALAWSTSLVVVAALAAAAL